VVIIRDRFQFTFRPNTNSVFGTAAHIRITKRKFGTALLQPTSVTLPSFGYSAEKQTE